MHERVKMGKTAETLGWFTLLLAVLLGVAVAELSIRTRNPMIVYIWSGAVLPGFLLLTTLYLVVTGKLKNRMKAWAVIACGMLLMSFSGILTSMRDFTIATMGLILLIVGFLIIIFAGLTFRVRKV